MNKIITIVLIIIVVVGGFFLFRNKASVTEKNQEATTNTNTTETSPKVNGVEVEVGAKMETGAIDEIAKKVTVNYTDSGFSPKTINIKKGDTVVFVNQSSESLWVASAPHPIHTDYPDFNEKAAISNGGSWSFTPDQIGLWKYHNHKNPSNTGAVIVE